MTTKSKRLFKSKIFQEFIESEKSGGIVLVFCTIISLLISNSEFSTAYHHFWSSQLFNESIEYWINDGLMVIFFLLIGLELEREVYQGELSRFKEALFPILGALGGMLIPALVYFYFNYNFESISGIGIPMATDIAFALGVLSLVGKKVPLSLKIFLTALAVIDDLGAILVIAIFYTKTLQWNYLLLALSVFAILLLLNRLKINKLFPYLIGGIFMWYFMLHSGVHATITGVLLAFAIPFGKGTENSISIQLQKALHYPVAFLILPIFALANTSITISSETLNSFTQPYSLGIFFGLLIGKPIGIFLLAFLAVKIKICTLPQNISWSMLFSVAILGGIGFTMSIFITLLAFNHSEIINNSKFIILISSFCAGLIGYAAVQLSCKNK
ncbi:MAG TPA: Na+/H+ antiporter NhaA [Saprospiraceae bacterium]|nr:Na+/H+ antiporter NhaA [Saprospiraceae bacterium]